MRRRDYAGGGASRSWDSYFGVADKSTGYYLEADITFSDRSKMTLRDFPPPVPNHTSIKFSDLSQFAQNSFVNINGKKELYREESELMLTFEKKVW